MTQTILCKYCQGSIKDTDRFCYYCGKSVHDDGQPTDAPNTQPAAAAPTADSPVQSELAAPMPGNETAQALPASETVANSNAIPVEISPEPQNTTPSQAPASQPDQAFSGGTQTQSEATAPNSFSASSDTPAQPAQPFSNMQTTPSDTSSLQSDFSAQTVVSTPPAQPLPSGPTDPPMPQASAPSQPTEPDVNTQTAPLQQPPQTPQDSVVAATAGDAG